MNSLQHFKKLLVERDISLTKEEDIIIWCCYKSGEYTVKQGYNLLENEESREKCVLGICWHQACLPKAGAFTWLASKGKILTSDSVLRGNLVPMEHGTQQDIDKVGLFPFEQNNSHNK